VAARSCRRLGGDAWHSSEGGSVRRLGTQWIALLGAATACASAAPLRGQSLPEKVSLVTVEDSYEVEIGIAVLGEAYGRVGIDVEVERLPGDLALRRSASGQAHGEVHRIDGIAEEYPSLIQVSIPINYIEVGVYSRDPELAPRSWTDLLGLEVGIVRGIIAAERLTDRLEVRRVDTYEELLGLLARGEVDAIVTPLINTEVALLRGELADGVHMNGVMDTYLLYHYLHEDHALLLPIIEPVLKDMLVRGRVTEIRSETLDRIRRDAAEGR
jgi:polar amino acid transport system substrate-binding protein